MEGSSRVERADVSAFAGVRGSGSPFECLSLGLGRRDDREESRGFETAVFEQSTPNFFSIEPVFRRIRSRSALLEKRGPKKVGGTDTECLSLLIRWVPFQRSTDRAGKTFGKPASLGFRKSNREASAPAEARKTNHTSNNTQSSNQ